MSLVVLLAACRDETSFGGGSPGGNSSDGGAGAGASNGGGGNPPADGGAGAGPSNGGGGEGAGAGPSNGGGGNGPQGGFGGEGGTPPQGGEGGGGGAPPAGENCVDGVDNDGDSDVDCLDAECLNQAVCGDLVINELDYDNVGADDNEFVEIYNAGTLPIDLDGLSFMRINGATIPGAVYGGADGILLTGTLDPDSYLVIASATVVVDPSATNVLLSGSIQNGNPDAIAIYDATHQVVIDALAYGGAVDDATIDGLSFDLTPAVATAALDSNSVAVSLIRFPNGSDTNNDVTDWATTTIITPGADNQQGLVPETNCSDGMDNNGNGDVDCDDTGCSGLACDAFGSLCVTDVCTCPGGATESLCNDGLDNDCDGDVDCDDPNCAAAPICGEDCDDGLDNNGNALADCLDPICAGQVCGANGLTCAGTVCACPGGATESVCNDGIDNNCNGQTDCADAACSASCVAPVLFFSEYAEGTMTRKALEIYNNGGTTADLSQCTINRYTNGSLTPTASLTLTGTLAAADTYVLCNPMSVQPGDPGGIPATQCDITAAFINHNGDDSYDLTCAGTMVDFLGQLASGNFAADVTLRRNCAVAAGKTMTATTFDSSEWTSLPVNTFDGLNARSCPLNP